MWISLTLDWSDQARLLKNEITRYLVRMEREKIGPFLARYILNRVVGPKIEFVASVAPVREVLEVCALLDVEAANVMWRKLYSHAQNVPGPIFCEEHDGGFGVSAPSVVAAAAMGDTAFRLLNRTGHSLQVSLQYQVSDTTACSLTPWCVSRTPYLLTRAQKDKFSIVHALSAMSQYGVHVDCRMRVQRKQQNVAWDLPIHEVFISREHGPKQVAQVAAYRKWLTLVKERPGGSELGVLWLSTFLTKAGDGPLPYDKLPTSFRFLGEKRAPWHTQLLKLILLPDKATLNPRFVVSHVAAVPPPCPSVARSVDEFDDPPVHSGSRMLAADVARIDLDKVESARMWMNENRDLVPVESLPVPVLGLVESYSDASEKTVLKQGT
jgi:hypothetical protein